MSAHGQEPGASERWYAGISRYQWLVLLIASLGWIFDVFEGQIFVASMREAMPSLIEPGATEGQIARYNNIALAAFSLGGALGGIGFGMLSDRIGRKRTLSATILCYSLFTCLSALSTVVAAGCISLSGGARRRGGMGGRQRARGRGFP